MKTSTKFKKPTISNVVKMASNLSKKLGESVSIEISTWSYANGDSSLRYKLYECRANSFCKSSENYELTWDQLVEHYYRLMES